MITSVPKQVVATRFVARQSVARGWVRAAVLLALVGCGAPSVQVAPEDAGGPPLDVVHIDDEHYLGTPMTAKNLTVWPVHTKQPLAVGEFLTLAEAQRTGQAEVRERGGGQGNPQQLAANDLVGGLEVEQVAEILAGRNGAAQGGTVVVSGANVDGVQVANIVGGGATVNTIEIENRGDVPILVCAGSLVRGGNQDRQIGEDIVIAANSTVPVEAFCVEQGRWSNQRAGVATTAAFEAVDLVAAKGVRMNGQYLKAQDVVWSNVAGLNGKLAAQVREAGGGGGTRPTAQAGVYTVTDPGVTSFFANVEGLPEQVEQDRKFYVDAVTSHFERYTDAGDEAPVGFAYAVNGEVTTVRTFAHPRLLRSYLAAFAQAMSVEAHLAAADLGDEGSFEPAGPDDVVNLVRELESAQDEEVQTAGFNRNFVRKGKSGFASRCDVPTTDGQGGTVTVTRDWTKK